MKKYFRLLEECFLVGSDYNGSCIYNVLTGNVYSMDKREASILNNLEKNISIKETSDLLNMSTEEIVVLTNKLEGSKIGIYVDNKIYIDKLAIDYSWQDLVFIKEKVNINKVNFIIEDDCEKDCYLCSNPKNVRILNCSGCFKNKKNLLVSSLSEKKKLIDELAHLKVKHLNFTGGDIFINFKENIELINYAKGKFFDLITLNIGGNNDLDTEQIKILNELRVPINITVEIKAVPLNNLLINSLIENGAKFPSNIILVFDEKTIKRQKEIVTQLKENFNNIFVDMIFNENCDEEKRNKTLHTFSKVDVNTFSIRKKFSECMSGMITISTNGDICVCPKLPNYKIGHISNLRESLKKGNIKTYWDLNKDKIKSCQKCKERYMCYDCRYVEFALGGNFSSALSCPKKV